MSIVSSDFYPQINACNVEIQDAEGELTNFICPTDDERLNLWTRVCAIQKRCLEMMQAVSSIDQPMERTTLLEAISALDKKIYYLFYKTFVLSPIFMTSLGNQDFFFSGLDSISVLSYKERLCKKVAAVLKALEEGSMEQSLYLHGLIPIDVRWTHYKNLSFILQLDDADGELGRKVFLDQDPLIRATCQQKLHAIAMDLFPFVDEMLFAASHEFEQVLSIFSLQYTQSTPWDNDALFMFAAKRCASAVLSFILSKDVPILQEILDFAYINAAGAGRIDVLELLENKGITFSEQVLCQAASLAGRQEKLVSYMHIMRKVRTLGLEGFSKMVLFAIRSKHLDFLQELLSSSTTDEYGFLDDAFEIGIRNRDFAIVKVLVDYSSEKRRDCYARSYILSAQSGSEEIVKFLSQLEGVDSKENHFMAFIEALIAGNFHLLPLFIINSSSFSTCENKLIESDNVLGLAQRALTIFFSLHEKLSKEQCNRVFIAFCNVPDRGSMDRLLDVIGPVDRKSIAKGLVVATERNHEDIARFLCSLTPSDAPLSFALIKASFFLAIENDRQSIMEILLKRCKWSSDEEFEAIVLEACRLRNHKVVQVLFSYGIDALKNDAIMRIILLVIENGDIQELEIIQYLIKKLSSNDLGKAIAHASLYRHSDIVTFLLRSATSIPAYFLSTAIINSIEHDDMENFSCLLGFIREGIFLSFSKEIIQNMLLLGCRRGRMNVVSFFVQQGMIYKEVLALCISQARGVEAEQIRQLLRSQTLVLSLDIADIDRGYVLSTLFSHVARYPRDYLEMVSNEGLPRYIALIDNTITQDQGGVTKQFIHTLVTALLDKQVLTKTSEGIPIAYERDTYAFKLFARFCSILYKQNQLRTDPLLTGIIFHRCFFELVKLCLINSSDDYLERQFCYILKNELPNYKAAFDYFLNRSNASLRKQCEELIMLLDLSGDPYDCAKKIVYDFIRPVQSFCEGVSPSLINIWMYFDSTILSNRIQGLDASKEQIIASLVPLYSNIESFNQKIDWMKEWMQAASQEEIMSFLFAVTGSRAWYANLKIEVGLSMDDRGIFVLRTCIQRIDIPNHSEIIKEEFISGLQQVIFSQDFNSK